MTGNEPEKTLGRRGTIPRGIEQSLAISKANSVAEDIGKVHLHSILITHRFDIFGLDNFRLG